MVRLEISTHIFLSDGLGTQQYHFWVHGIVENKVVSFLLIFVILMIFQSFTASLVFSNWENHQTWQEFGKSEEILQYNNKLPKPGKKTGFRYSSNITNTYISGLTDVIYIRISQHN